MKATQQTCSKREDLCLLLIHRLEECIFQWFYCISGSHVGEHATTWSVTFSSVNCMLWILPSFWWPNHILLNTNPTHQYIMCSHSTSHKSCPLTAKYITSYNPGLPNSLLNSTCHGRPTCCAACSRGRWMCDTIWGSLRHSLMHRPLDSSTYRSTTDRCGSSGWHIARKPRYRFTWCTT